MTIAQMLFSFEGRMRRRDFWLVAIVLGVAHSVLVSIVSAAFFPPIVMNWDYGGGGYPGWGYGSGMWMYWSHMAPAFGLVSCLLLWPRLAIGVKRFHDRDKSGLWLLLCLLPIIGWLWLLIELGFLDGTQGPNKYGSSPKGFSDVPPTPVAA